MSDVSCSNLVAVDLDGVLAKKEPWDGVENIPEPCERAGWFVRALRDRGHRVIIHTSRINSKVNSPVERAVAAVERWLEEHGIPYDEIWDGVGKPVAGWYVGDDAVNCQAGCDNGEVDGFEYEYALKVMGYYF